MRVAVVDLGTNSTRLLVAEVEDGRVHEIERLTRVTRLGRGVDLTGLLSQEGIGEVCDTVRDYLDIAGEHSPEKVIAIATSAVRDAENGDVFAAELRERFALDPRIIDGLEEAQLTYLGATSGRTNGGGPRVVIDIGGGSTEIVVGEESGIGFFASLQAGVVRHSERHLSTDPPDPSALEDLAADVRGLLETGVPEESRRGVKSAIAVAGTPTSLAAIDLHLDPYDRERVHGHELPFEVVQRLLCELAAMPLAERETVTGLQPERAPTIVAGVVILTEVLRAFGLDRVEVSEHDILYGGALDAASS